MIIILFLILCFYSLYINGYLTAFKTKEKTIIYYIMENNTPIEVYYNIEDATKRLNYLINFGDECVEYNINQVKL